VTVRDRLQRLGSARLAGALCLGAGALALAGCAERGQGNAGGEAVRMQVHLERAFTRHLQNHVWTFGASASGAYGVPMASGVGLSITTTTVSHMGGKEPGGAEVFLHDLSWGDQGFTVPLDPGKSLYLSVLVEGGHRGLIVLGKITVPPSQHARVGIRLAGDGARMVVAPPTAMIMASDRDAVFGAHAGPEQPRGPDTGPSGSPPAPRTVGAVGGDIAPASGPLPRPAGD
jgi:hypothetical protein